MSVAELVSHLKSLDVRLKAEGSRLRINAPKGVLSDSLRAQLAERKQELLEFLCVSQTQDTFVPPPIERRVVDDPAPLSFAQERLWFLEQLEPGSAVYNICRASRLTGQLNIAALKLSLSEIVRRHEILRSQIRVVDGGPVQVTVAVSNFDVPVIDLCSVTEPEREREVRDRIEAEAERQFDFSAGLFLRAVLLQFSNDDHILILTTHHIVADAWSMGILTRELWTLYGAHANGRASALKALPVQYADYAVWQREWLQGDILETQLCYWKKQLANVPMLNLPIDRTRPAQQSYRGARQPITLSESLTAAVNTLSEREGATQFMTLLAVFYVLLYRYSRQEDVVVGSPIVNRNRTEIEKLIGFFVNTLALRVDLSGKPTFRELLFRVRDVCFGAYAHQDLPFEKLVEELQPQRDLSRNPLFQVMFLLQNAPSHIPELAELTVGRIGVDTGTSKFDLTLGLAERDEKLVGFFEYNTDLFDQSTIERMVGHFKMLLQGIVANPDQPISTLPLLTEAERHQLLVEWNDTKTNYPKNTCVHELFEAQVKRTPEAIAVLFEGKQLTYRELNSRANQLARYLQGLGVGPEKFVGICVERTLEMVVGLLGILKAGGAYVPLDPAYPIERLAFMIADAQISVLVTQEKLDQICLQSLVSSQVTNHDSKIVYLDKDWKAIAQQSGENPKSKVNSKNLGYVIYTSGSTGAPKGVAMAHRSLQNLITWQLKNLRTPRAARVLQFTSLSFDVSFQEIFATWCSGGTLLLISEDLKHDPVGLLRELENQSIERLFLPFVALERLAEAADDENVNCKNLREIITAGEQLKITPQIRRFFDRLKGCSLHNQYGPTETHVVTSFLLTGAPSGWVSCPPIGRPITNTQVYVLDSFFQLVPIGVRGELYIGGDGLARGYLNRPELTAEKFITCFFSQRSNTRLYRTGDLARYLPDGAIEFLGRADSQLKIRGYRIELGEIEAALNQHPAVKECAVVTCDEEKPDSNSQDSNIENPKFDKRLIVYFVLRQQTKPTGNELRSFLKTKLPDYMIPSSFMALETLPLLPNGKLDRRALSAIRRNRLEVSQRFVEPRTEIEQLITQVWRAVLQVEKIGIHDNFFELGGHSLLATQIVAGLRDSFSREIPLRVLFESPTVAALGKEVAGLIQETCEPELPSIMPVSRDGCLPLSINQEHLWRLDQMFPGNHFFNMPYVYRINGRLDVIALERSFEEIVKRHEALRTFFAEADGHPVQIVKSAPDFQLPIVDLRILEPEEISDKAAGFILEERQQPFDLAAGPLIRIKLLELTDDAYLLLVTMHHIISDEWSVRIFRRELTDLYEAFSLGRVASLPEPPIQYGDFATWEVQLVESGLLYKQLDYWRTQLAGPLPQLQFRKARKRKGALSFRTKRQPIDVDKNLSAAIKTFASKEHVTPFIVVLSALSVLLYHWTGQPDIRIGTLVANRARKESQEVIGHFVNTVVVRTAIDATMTLRQVIKQVRTIFHSALANQELPFEQLARVIEGEGIDRRASLFQVLLRYHDASFQTVNLPGISFAPVRWQQSLSISEVMLTACDIVFDVQATENKLTGHVNYKTDTCGNDVVAAMIHRFVRLLKHMIVDTRTTVSSVS